MQRQSVFVLWASLCINKLISSQNTHATSHSLMPYQNHDIIGEKLLVGRGSNLAILCGFITETNTIQTSPLVLYALYSLLIHVYVIARIHVYVHAYCCRQAGATYIIVIAVHSSICFVAQAFSFPSNSCLRFGGEVYITFN